MPVWCVWDLDMTDGNLSRCGLFTAIDCLYHGAEDEDRCKKKNRSNKKESRGREKLRILWNERVTVLKGFGQVSKTMKTGENERNNKNSLDCPADVEIG